MKVIIRYAKLSSADSIEVFGDFRYEIDIDVSGIDNPDQMIIDNTKAVMENYGEYRLERYLEKDADVFACFLDDVADPFYISKKDEKKDPVSIVDGMIRRMKVRSAVLSNGLITHKLIDLEPVEHDYIYAESIVTELKDSEKNISGEKITAFFPYRDGGYSKIPNRTCVDNTIPFVYFLKGNIIYEEQFYDEDVEWSDEAHDYVKAGTITPWSSKSTYATDFEVISIGYGNDVIYLLKGDTNGHIYSDAYNPPTDKDESYKGLFYSNLSLFHLKNNEGVLLGQNLIPWKYIYHDGQARFKTTSESYLEEMIKNDNFVSINPGYSIKMIIRESISRALKDNGFDLSLDFMPGKGINNSKDVVYLNTKQSEDLFNCFVDEFSYPVRYKTNPENVEAIILSCIDKLNESRTEGGVSAETMKDFLDTVSKLVGDNTIIKERDLRRTAIHEMGHALVGKLVSNIDGLWDTVTIIPENGTGGHCDYSNKCRDLNMECEKWMMIYLGGRTAEKICMGREDSGWSQDYIEAKGLVMRAMMEDDCIYYLDENTQSIICKYHAFDPVPADEMPDRCVEQVASKTEALLSKYKPALEKLAERILSLDKKEISGETFEEWCRDLGI